LQALGSGCGLDLINDTKAYGGHGVQGTNGIVICPLDFRYF